MSQYQWSTSSPTPAEIQAPSPPKFAQNQPGFNIIVYPKMHIIILENEGFWAMKVAIFQISACGRQFCLKNVFQVSL